MTDPTFYRSPAEAIAAPMPETGTTSSTPTAPEAWRAEIDADTGGLSLDEDLFLSREDFRGLRVHQIRLQGGDASSDSCCHRT
ncbi:hypothetical protein [Kocuria rhizosphaericola]|uniref:hypothetical protein n=1 Tax=Kocuria rhizosphaericola TaxID=3376284 RepID=UPI00378BE49B